MTPPPDNEACKHHGRNGGDQAGSGGLLLLLDDDLEGLFHGNLAVEDGDREGVLSRLELAVHDGLPGPQDGVTILPGHRQLVQVLVGDIDVECDLPDITFDRFSPRRCNIAPNYPNIFAHIVWVEELAVNEW